MLHPENAPPPNPNSARPPPDRKRHGFLSLLVRALFPLGILAVGYWVFSLLAVEVEQEKSDPVEEQVIRTRVTKLSVSDFPVVITTNGVVQSHNEVPLSAQVSGQVLRISPEFEAGSYFSTGDVLVELDARDYLTDVAVAEAERLGAESALELATANHERNTKLYENKVISISEAELNQTAALCSQTAAELDAAVANLERAKRDLERTKILAPFDGRVLQQSVGVGQLVAPGAPLGVVFAVDFAEVRLPIAGPQLQHLDLPELPDDPPVEVELRDAIDTSSETVWKASIVRTEGALDADSLELFAIARVDDPFGRISGQPPLRIGQPVIASIVGQVLTNVIALPREAVRQLDQVVLVNKADMTLSPMTITPIWSDEDHIIIRDPSITDGSLLSTTQLVYAPGGAKVEIIPDIEHTAATGKTDETVEQ